MEIPLPILGYLTMRRRKVAFLIAVLVRLVLSPTSDLQFPGEQNLRVNNILRIGHACFLL